MPKLHKGTLFVWGFLAVVGSIWGNALYRNVYSTGESALQPNRVISATCNILSDGQFSEGCTDKEMVDALPDECHGEVSGKFTHSSFGSSTIEEVRHTSSHPHCVIMKGDNFKGSLNN